jgi:hypothetical protein
MNMKKLKQSLLENFQFFPKIFVSMTMLWHYDYVGN